MRSVDRERRLGREWDSRRERRAAVKMGRSEDEAKKCDLYGKAV